MGPRIGDDNTLQLEWAGERSASSISEGILAKPLRFTSGSADFLFFWEGMGVEGIRVVDGVMTKHNVELKLGKEL
jgi:hypothetical protein